VITNGNAALRWLDRATPDLAEAIDALNGVVKEGKRASDVIGRIRSFLRHHKPDFVDIDINDTIEEILTLANNTLRERHVAVQTSLPTAIPRVLGDRVQLQQVIMNLVMNGADAMNSVTGRPKILRIESHAEGAASVRVSVKDTGAGIDKTIAHRIFDPLFTTKPTGMGMGLAICRGIVEAHGGRLWASPGPSHGADFHFTIPSVAAGAAISPEQRQTKIICPG
jgi:signal transduction histidine kinase